MRTRLIFLGAAILLAAVSAHAGGPGPAQRLLRLGRCSPGGQPCSYDCPSRQVQCPAGQTCVIQPTDSFTGRIVIYVDDSNGPRFELLLKGKRRDGTPFTVAESLYYSQSGSYCPSDSACPGSELVSCPFLCSA